MARPTLGERAMTAAERKRRQVSLERAGQSATNAAIDRAVVRVFIRTLRAKPSASAIEVMGKIVEEFPATEQQKVAVRLRSHRFD